LDKGIAIAGTIAVDEVKYVKSYPPKSELTTIQEVKRFVGGAVSNCSTALSRIDSNLPIEIVAFIGDDEKGHYLKSELSKYANINMKFVKETGETPYTDVIHDLQDNTRTFFSYKGNSSLFDENTINFGLLNSHILHIAYILLLDSLDQEDPIYGTKMAKLLKRAQEHGLKTSIDIVSENSDRYERIVPPSLKYTNYCIVNEIEAGNTVGISLRDETTGKLNVHLIRNVLSQLKEMGVKDWVVIHTPECSFGYDGEHFYSIPSLFIEREFIKGTVGAGDAYVSGVLYGAWKGHSLPDAMKIGTAAAGSSLFARDSSSAIKPYQELINMYESIEKQQRIEI
jgi:sugar/nucleoside kinase (ribokinase family)